MAAPTPNIQAEKIQGSLTGATIISSSVSASTINSLTAKTNVLSATTMTANTLSIDGIVAGNGILMNSITSNAVAIRMSKNNVSQFYIGSNSGANLDLDLTNVGLGAINFSTNSITRATIDNIGNTSFGGSPISSRLAVKGSGITSSTTAFTVTNSANTTNFNVLDNGNIGIGIPTPIALLHISNGSTTIPPLKLTSGTSVTTPLSGSVEYNGNQLFFTPLTTRKTFWLGGVTKIGTGYTITTNDFGGFVNFTATTGGIITLPAASGSTIPTGVPAWIKDAGFSATTNPITVIVQSNLSLIDGLSATTININKMSIGVYSDGTNYFIT